MTSLSVISPDRDPDSDIIPRLQAGDERALAALMDRHLKTLHGLAFHMLGDAFLAEDVTQTVFLKTWETIPNWTPGQAKLLTWMCRVTKNLCLDQLRKKKPHYSDRLPEQADDTPLAFDALAQQDQSRLVKEAIAQLPERQRLALTLSFFQGLSQKDGAAIMELSVSAYESLLARGRRQLRNLLDPTDLQSFVKGASL